MALTQVLVFLAFFFIALVAIIGLIHHFVPPNPSRSSHPRKRLHSRLHSQYQPSTL